MSKKNRTQKEKYIANYAELDRVLELAYTRASEGKGKIRHADQNPFEKQPIVTEGEVLGINGHLFQIRKKALELRRLPREAAMKEVLDIVVYACATYLILEKE